jgi:CBS domain-containing protein
MKSCREVMTANPVCCLPGDTVEQVARTMKTEDVGPIPVIENHTSRKLVGIVTDRDLVIKVLAEGRNGQDTNVETVMTHDPITCEDQDSLDKAMQLMSEHQIRRIPIVNARHEIVGIIAQADIATRVDEPQKVSNVVEEISKPDTASASV